MDILIACHSQYEHYPVTIHPEELNHRVDYIDTGKLKLLSQYNDWSKLPHTFYDMVWGIQCPIYMPFVPKHVQDYGLTLEILNAAWKVLTEGGIFVMPLNPDLIRRSSLKQIEEKAKVIIVDAKSEGHWSVESTKIKDMPIQVESPYEYALVFTKKMKGGRRRARKTMRRRYRR